MKCLLFLCPFSFGPSSIAVFAVVFSTGERDDTNLPSFWAARKCSLKVLLHYVGVSKNRGFYPQIIPILIGFSIISHPFWDIPVFGNTHVGHPKNDTFAHAGFAVNRGIHFTTSCCPFRDFFPILNAKQRVATQWGLSTNQTEIYIEMYGIFTNIYHKNQPFM